FRPRTDAPFRPRRMCDVSSTLTRAHHVNTVSRLFCLLSTAVLFPLCAGAQSPANPRSDALPPASAPPPAPALTTPDVNAWLDGLVPFALKEHGLASAVVVVVKDGAVLTAK